MIKFGVTWDYGFGLHYCPLERTAYLVLWNRCLAFTLV